jgi:hypothetical protein
MLNLTSSLNPKLLVAAGILMAAASTALANPTTVFLETGPQYGGSNPYQYYNGGEFTALTTGLTPTQIPAGYATVATLQVGAKTGFETFCIEDGVEFQVGQTYKFTEGTAIQQTGGTLSAGAAWLYMEFATGQLSGYDYTNAANRLQDAGELQAALWYLQGEPADGGDAYNGVGGLGGDPFTNLAVAAFGNSLSAAEAGVTSSTTFGVQVMELTNNDGAIAQDQLIYTAVPDTATTLLLLSVSLVALALFKRRVTAA